MFLTLLLVPYLLTPERQLPKRRQQHRGAAQARRAQREEAENRERRRVTQVMQILIVVEVVGVGVATGKEVVSKGRMGESAFVSVATLITLLFASIMMYKPLPPPPEQPIVVRFFEYRPEAPIVIRGEDEEAGIVRVQHSPEEWETPPHSVSTEEY